MIKILLTSTSSIKRLAVNKFFNEINEEIILDCISKNNDNLLLPAQPVNCSIQCAFMRMIAFNNELSNYDMIISIENDITLDERSNQYYDCAGVIISLNNGTIGIGFGDKILCPIKENNLGYPIVFSENIRGYTTTAGNYFESQKLTKNANNWMLDMANIDRVDQILTGLHNAYQNLQKNKTNFNAH